MRKKVIKNNMSGLNKNLIGLGISSVSGTIIAVILSFIFSYIFANAETLSESMGAVFVICIFIGGLICGIISARLTNLKGLVSGSIASIIYLLLITIIMLFFANGRLSATTLFLYLGTVIASIIGGIFGANLKRRK